MAMIPNDPLPTAFPTIDVEAALDEWWESEQEDAALPGDPAPVVDIMTPATEIDSHRAVRALLVLQEVVKFEIPDTAIRKGGYDDYADMKADLVPRLQALFEKERKKQNA